MGEPVVSKVTKSITISEASFIMHPSGALYWEERDLLIISDVHLGKISHFRKYGSAIPQQAIKGNFEKLNEVLAFFAPGKVMFLGDLFHSSLNNEWLLFEEWLDGISADVILIEGNHDIISPLKYEALGVQIFPELIIDDFLFTHHPEKRRGFFNFSGHIHPGVKIVGLARQDLKLACFFKCADQMILPAFGEFTGKHILSPCETDEVYVVTKQEVILLE